jgi:hypothetical protein
MEQGAMRRRSVPGPVRVEYGDQLSPHRFAARRVRALACLLLLGASYILLPGYGVTGVGVAFDLTQASAASLQLFTDLRPMVGLRLAA